MCTGRCSRASPNRRAVRRKSYLAALEEHRNSIEQIASAKYDEGDYHRYANSTVVPVGMADWAHHGAI